MTIFEFGVMVVALILGFMLALFGIAIIAIGLCDRRTGPLILTAFRSVTLIVKEIIRALSRHRPR